MQMRRSKVAWKIASSCCMAMACSCSALWCRAPAMASSWASPASRTSSDANAHCTLAVSAAAELATVSRTAWFLKPAVLSLMALASEVSEESPSLTTLIASRSNFTASSTVSAAILASSEVPTMDLIWPTFASMMEPGASISPCTAWAAANISFACSAQALAAASLCWAALLALSALAPRAFAWRIWPAACAFAASADSTCSSIRLLRSPRSEESSEPADMPDTFWNATICVSSWSIISCATRSSWVAWSRRACKSRILRFCVSSCALALSI
mmetsp:Transcript_16274/g.43040  ORF Transcript_16274/g.43040 Transcript_16274/m.43040 type:complete len:272 (-) Transcript_16274:757-1572(-)